MTVKDVGSKGACLQTICKGTGRDPCYRLASSGLGDPKEYLGSLSGRPNAGEGNGEALAQSLPGLYTLDIHRAGPAGARPVPPGPRG